MPTNEERREVADGLRRQVKRLGPQMDAHEFAHYGADVIDSDNEILRWDQMMLRLADLIEPEERTCHIEPLSLREFFTGERYVLTSEAMESAEDERFDRISRELEEDAHFTCSSCHTLFGTREVANADYDILEDGTYEVSGVAPIIKFCPNCGAKVVRG